MTALLEVHGLSVSYRGVRAVREVSLSAERGQAVALFGPNGAGKTSLVNGVAGFGPVDSGEVRLAGRDLGSAPPHVRARMGVGLVPAGRWLFGQLSVEQNLRLGTRVPGRSSHDLSYAYDLFPVLATRTRQFARTLSGGEQQMLAIARALLSKPDVLILDEPSLGLAPVMVEKVYDALTAIKREGQTLVVVEERTEFALDLCDTFVALYGGEVVNQGSRAEIDSDVLAKNYLG